MKDGYREILSAKREDRRQLFADATERWATSANFIEKDFIVSATLDVLFGDASEADKLVFKGGTSLSKGHDLINRFSEDIDLVIVRQELGFADDRDPMNPEADLSNKKRGRLKEELTREAGKHVQNQLRPLLEEALAPLGVKIETQDGSNDQTLLIAYPSVFDEADEYVSPVVKLEAGARSATLPAKALTITPYVADELDLDLVTTGVHTIAAERTFLDKLVILHGRHCKFRDTGKIHNNANRESRHYYDVAMMAENVGVTAVKDSALLADVIHHSQLAFPSGWAKFDEAREGKLLIIPPDGMVDEIRRDYQAMQGMILGEAPKFDDVLSSITKVSERYYGSD